MKNQQGDITGLMLADGTIVVTYEYDAWGNILNITGGRPHTAVRKMNSYIYRGYLYDQTTGFYYLQSRYYDPQVGRFLNADDTNYLGATGTTLGCNLYAYCENCVISKFDPNGTDAVILQYKNAAKGLGHIGALVQSASGQWYYFYWGSSVGMVASLLISTKAFCMLHALSAWGDFYLLFSSVCSFLANRDKYINKNGKIKYANGLTSAIYLSGDFSQTYNYYYNQCKNAITKSSWNLGHYNLYTYNCKHATLEGLLKSPVVYNNRQLKNRITTAKSKIIPNEAFAYIKKMFQ